MWQEFQAKSLNNHLSIHTGEKSYKYATCAKSFSLVHHLKQHILIHTGEKPCICTKCDSRFSQASSLNTHMRIHTEKKVYKYDICPIKVPDNVPDKVTHVNKRQFEGIFNLVIKRNKRRSACQLEA